MRQEILIAMDKNTREFILNALICLLAGVVTVASVMQLLFDQTVPGLIPLGTAFLMIPVWLRFREAMPYRRLVGWMMVAAFGLNIAAGVLQIVNA